MKKFFTVLLVISLAFINYTAIAQIEINAYGGWVPAANTMYSYNGYRLRIDGAANYGIGLGYATPYGIVAELSYMRFSSEISQNGGVQEIVERQPINVEYYQLGVQKPFQDSETLVPYGLFSLGASRFNPTEETEDYLMENKGIKNYTVSEVRFRKLEVCVQEDIDKLDHCDAIYITFDVDSLDCDFVSRGTGTPVSFGFNPTEAKDIILGFLKTEKVVCVEFTEVNPLLDNKGNKMAETAFDILNHCFNT